MDETLRAVLGIGEATERRVRDMDTEELKKVLENERQQLGFQILLAFFAVVVVIPVVEYFTINGLMGAYGTAPLAIVLSINGVAMFMVYWCIFLPAFSQQLSQIKKELDRRGERIGPKEW